MDFSFLLLACVFSGSLHLDRLAKDCLLAHVQPALHRPWKRTMKIQHDHIVVEECLVVPDCDEGSQTVLQRHNVRLSCDSLQ